VGLPHECSTVEQVFYTRIARSRSGSSSFTALAPEYTELLLLLHRGGMVLVTSTYAGPVRPAAALHDSVLCLTTDNIHSLLVNNPSSSSCRYR